MQINSNMLSMLGWPEIIGILVIVLVLFGAKKLPELAKGLGSGIKEFKKASREVQDDLQRAIDEEPPPPPPRKPAPPADTVAKGSSEEPPKS
ncbi:MAG: twin-arginine translocase TatA/TatE family subunit [Verrucomicrobia bacterium]|nr:twin-arginine translocase TatA/TatE family subunit [Verrucomicrobiota bacterium]